MAGRTWVEGDPHLQPTAPPSMCTPRVGSLGRGPTGRSARSARIGCPTSAGIQTGTDCLLRFVRRELSGVDAPGPKPTPRHARDGVAFPLIVAAARLRQAAPDLPSA